MSPTHPHAPDIRAGEHGYLEPLNAATTVYANAIVAKSGAGLLLGFSGYSSRGSAQFIQWFDAQKVPANGAVPMGFLTVAATSNFAVGWSSVGRSFLAGIVLVNSSTGPTLTIGSADCWFDAQYV